MEELFAYMFRSFVWLAVFTLVYLVFLRNEKYFVLKRIYLIAGIIVSIAFPFITLHYQIDMAVPERVLTDSGPSVISSSVQVNYSPDRSFDYRLILLIIYLTGILLLLYRMIRYLIPVLGKISKSHITDMGSARLIRCGEYRSSFSFFNFVFIDSSIEDPEAEEIMNHEMVHVKQKHWMDLILVESIRIIQWINPFAWIYPVLVKQNHEFLADEEALRLTSNPANYRAAVLNQLFNTRIVRLSNSFSGSFSKKRFDMMKNIRTSPLRKLKIFIVLPVIALIFYAFAEPVYPDPAYSVPAIQDTIKEQKKEKSAVSQFSRNNPDDYPTFQGKGLDSFRDWVMKRVTYPSEALAEMLEGWIMVKFTVGSDGSVGNVRYAGKASPVLGEEVVRVVKTSPKWEPAKNPAARVPYETSVTARFLLPDKFKRIEPQTNTDQMPQYPGGEAEMLKFIAKNIKYPPDAKEQNIQGKVFVGFVINKEGKARNFRIIESVFPSLDLEAVRVLGLLKDFTPGYRDGKPVDVEYVVPINFVLKNNGTLPVSKPQAFTAADSALHKDNTVISKEIVVIGYANGIRSQTPLRIFNASEKPGGDPLFVIDGKPSSREEMERLDVTSIESVSVLKGERVIDKYGEGAKYGVVIIKLKEKL